MKSIKSICISSIVSLLICGCSDNRETLQVYSWSDYFDPELIQCFEKENNCHIMITSFDSNEALYAKLKAGGNGYDIMIPSSYIIPTLIKENIISRIDTNLIPNVVKNFDHSFDNQVLDSEFKWSVPYACTYTGLMYSKKNVSDASSWGILSNTSLSKKVSLLDDIRELVGIGLMYNGYSLNSTNRSEIIKAANTVIEWKRINVRKFDAESYKNEVADGSIYLGHGYSSDAAQVIIGDDRSDIGFSLPNEGFTIAWDEFVISSKSTKKELAHKFINFFYDDGVSYTNMLYICSMEPNKNSIKRIPDEYKEFFIPSNLDKGQLLKGFDNPDVMKSYNEAFDMIKSFR